MLKQSFEEIIKVKIQDKRNLVISKSNNGKVVIGQQIVFEEGNKQIGMFLKGAIFIDPERLLELHNAIGETINILGLEK